MIVLLDTDVLIAVALDRSPHAEPAARLLDTVQAGTVLGFMAWHSVSNFHTMVSPLRGRAESRRFLVELASFVAVAPTDTASLLTAASLELNDFEDAMQVAAALAAGADVIATRNVRDYGRSPIRALTPSDVLRDLA